MLPCVKHTLALVPPLPYGSTPDTSLVSLTLSKLTVVPLLRSTVLPVVPLTHCGEPVMLVTSADVTVLLSRFQVLPVPPTSS